MLRVLILATIVFLSACQKKSGRKEIWIYTSLYKDTIAEMGQKLEQLYPDVKINWYQAGSEEIAAKINTELIAGVPKADILISSERFWYQELSDSGKLVSWKPPQFDTFRDEYKNSAGTFHIVSVPVMAIVYNSDVIKEADAPRSFKDLAHERFRGIATGGSPLASGTAFTTVLALQKRYGWEYFQELKKNGFLFDGGNSAVIKRIQTKERPVGFVLLENVLRFQKDDERLKIVYPEDGVVTQFNTMGIPKKDGDLGTTLNIAEWFFSNEGQQTMINSFMHASVKNFAAPQGAPTLEVLKQTAFPWTPELIQEMTEKRFDIKEKYVEIMFK